MIITFVNGKGGVGKTTLSVLMALLYHELGKKTALSDADPQKTATKWLNEIKANHPEACPEIAREGVAYEFVVIDTPPRLETDEVRSSIRTANIVVVLSSPSPADLWTTKDTVQVVRENLQNGAKAALLFNQVVGNTLLGREIGAMGEQIGLQTLKNAVPRSVSFQHAAIYGMPALTSAAKEALHKVALEIATL